jgi:phosphonopyruvate decarboxylase
MVGSMGCASSFSLGIALACQERRIIVLDGDGAALMRLGAMAVIGFEKPRNLVHVMFDNQMYESTGAQPSVSTTLDFCGIARSCGYPAVCQIDSVSEIKSLLGRLTDTLQFIYIRVAASDQEVTKRPGLPLEEYKIRFSRFLQGGK